MMNADELRIVLIQTYASGLESLWGYYFTVIVGTVAVVASLLGEDGKLGKVSARFLVTLLGAFGVANVLSMLQTSKGIRSLIAAVENEPLKSVLEAQNYLGWSTAVAPIGAIVAIMFVVWKS